MGSYAIETPNNGSKHSRLTAVLQEDRDKHLPLICVTQFLSGQAAQLDTRPILVNDASAPTIPIRYGTAVEHPESERGYGLSGTSRSYVPPQHCSVLRMFPAFRERQDSNSPARSFVVQVRCTSVRHAE